MIRRALLGYGVAAALAAITFAQDLSPTYEVCKGDTLSSIARRKGTTVDAICAINNLKHDGKLYPGLKLRLPSAPQGKTAAEPSAKAAPASTEKKPAPAAGQENPPPATVHLGGTPINTLSTSTPAVVPFDRASQVVEEIGVKVEQREKEEAAKIGAAKTESVRPEKLDSVLKRQLEKSLAAHTNTEEPRKTTATPATNKTESAEKISPPAEKENKTVKASDKEESNEPSKSSAAEEKKSAPEPEKPRKTASDETPASTDKKSVPEKEEEEPAAPPAMTAENRPEIHTVALGDNLFQVARRYNMTADELRALNKLEAKPVLRIGQKLRLRPASTTAAQEKNSAPETEKKSTASTTKKSADSEPEKSSNSSARDTDNPPEEKKGSSTAKKESGEESAAQDKDQDKPQKGKKTTEIAEVKSDDNADDNKKDMRDSRTTSGRNSLSTVNSKGRAAPVQTSSSKNSSTDDDNDAAPNSSSSFSFFGFGRSSSKEKYVFLAPIIKTLDNTPIKRRWINIVLHHSATASGNAAIFERVHRARGMENGMAYHFLIGNGSYTGDGEIEIGNRWLKQLQGGHVQGDALNEISIGICFVGDFTKHPPSPRQIAAAVELIQYIRKRCGSPKPKLWLHREINPNHTECPGRQFPGAAIRKAVD